MPLWLRVSLSFSALLAMLFGLALTGVYRDTQSGLWLDLDRELLNLARTELSSAVDDPEDGPHLHAKGANHQAVLFLGDGRLLATTPGLAPKVAGAMVQRGLSRAGSLSGDQPDFFTFEEDRNVLLPAVLGEAKGRGFMLLRSPLEPVRRTLATIRHRLWLWGLVGTLVGSLLAGLLTRRLTRPLGAVAQAAEKVRQGDWSQRVPLSRESQEIQTLELALNEMLESLLQRAQQQRQFMADASHELRNPLHSLGGTLEVALRRERSPEEYREVLQVGVGETRRLQKLVEDMLILARSDLERLDLQRAEVDLEEILQAACRAFQARASQRNIELKLDWQPCRLKVDAAKLRQSLDNLVDNALRYAPEQSRIDITQSLGPGQVCWSVADRGPGMTGAEYEEIFQRFTRLDRARSRESGGMGLGLAIARSLVRAHGGSLKAGPRPDGGSVFEIRLPLVSSDAAADRPLLPRLPDCPV